MLARLSDYLGAHHGTHRAEHERDRALQRALIAAAVGLVGLWHLARSAQPDLLAWVVAPASVAYALWSLAYRQALRRHPHGRVTTQTLMLVLDPPLTFLALTGAAPLLGAFHPLVMVQVVRSGLRYGPRTLALSTVSALVASALLIPLSPFWLENELLMRSYLVSLVLPPLLFAPLIRRLHANTGALEQAAQCDALTGLANRRGLVEGIERAAERARQSGTALGVVVVDLDNFKPVNDSLGHAAGDRLLVQMAQAIRGACRAGDLVARVGGDEFVLLLEGLTGSGAPEQLQRVAAKVLQAVDATARVAVPTIPVSASLGTLCWRPADEDAAADHVIARADRALYEAKRGGKARIVVAPDLG